MNLPLPTKISSYADAKAFLKQVRECELQLFLRGINERAHFRGEEDIAYTLRPKITRYGHSSPELAAIEPKLMGEFKDELKARGLYMHIREGFIGFPHHEEWLFYQQAQHLGLATRFLDWTLKYEVALFFACQSLIQTNGKLYVYVPSSKIFQADRRDDNYANFHPTQITTPVFLNPSDFGDDNSMVKFAQRFRARQHGRFLITPLDSAVVDMKNELQHDSYFHTVTILHNAKVDILRGIDTEEAITQQTLFIENDPEAVKFKKETAPIIEQLHQKYLQ